MYKIILNQDFDSEEWIWTAKGCYLDAILEFSGRTYRINFYDPSRLNQDIGDWIATDESAFFEKNLVVIRSITRQNITEAIDELVKNDRIGTMIHE